MFTADDDDERKSDSIEDVHFTSVQPSSSLSSSSIRVSKHATPSPASTITSYSNNEARNVHPHGNLPLISYTDKNADDAISSLTSDSVQAHPYDTSKPFRPSISKRYEALMQNGAVYDNQNRRTKRRGSDDEIGGMGGHLSSMSSDSPGRGRYNPHARGHTRLSEQDDLSTRFDEEQSWLNQGLGFFNYPHAPWMQNRGGKGRRGELEGVLGNLREKWPSPVKAMNSTFFPCFLMIHKPKR